MPVPWAGAMAWDVTRVKIPRLVARDFAPLLDLAPLLDFGRQLYRETVALG
jgi:hypothetical protein